MAFRIVDLSKADGALSRPGRGTPCVSFFPLGNGPKVFRRRNVSATGALKNLSGLLDHFSRSDGPLGSLPFEVRHILWGIIRVVA